MEDTSGMNRSGASAETKAFRLLYGKAEPVSKLFFGGVGRQQQVVEARVRRWQALGITTHFRYDQIDCLQPFHWSSVTAGSKHQHHSARMIWIPPLLSAIRNNVERAIPLCKSQQHLLVKITSQMVQYRALLYFSCVVHYR